MNTQAELIFPGERVPLPRRARHPVCISGFVHLAKCRRRDGRLAELREHGLTVGWLIWASVAARRGHMPGGFTLNDAPIPEGYPRAGLRFPGCARKEAAA